MPASSGRHRGLLLAGALRPPTLEHRAANRADVGNNHAEDVRDRSQGAAFGGALRRAVRHGGLEALRGARLGAELLHGQHGKRHAGSRRAQQGGLERRRRHDRRLDAAADGDFRFRRRGGAVRAGRPGGRRRRRAGNRLRQPRLHAAEQRLSGALFLHQGCAPVQGRRGQGVVGMPAGSRARDLSRSTGRCFCADRGAARRRDCRAQRARSAAARGHASAGWS